MNLKGKRRRIVRRGRYIHFYIVIFTHSNGTPMRRSRRSLANFVSFRKVERVGEAVCQKPLPDASRKAPICARDRILAFRNIRQVSSSQKIENRRIQQDNKSSE